MIASVNSRHSERINSISNIPVAAADLLGSLEAHLVRIAVAGCTAEVVGRRILGLGCSCTLEVNCVFKRRRGGIENVPLLWVLRGAASAVVLVCCHYCYRIRRGVVLIGKREREKGRIRPRGVG